MNKLCALLSLLPSLVFAANSLPVKSTGDLPFYFDTASFQSSVGSTFQEFYYQMPLDQLSFVSIDSTLRDTLQVALSITEDSQQVYSDSWLTPVQSDLKQELAGRFAPQQFELLLKPGKYKARLDIYEIGGKKNGAAELDFQALDFQAPQLTLSSIQCASEVRKDSTQSKFTKNGFFLLPNPSRIYGNALSMLIFYYEIYHLSSDAQNTHFSIQYDICNAGGEIVRQFPVKKKQKHGSTSADLGALSVAALPDTLYTLQVTVTDSANGQIARTGCAFRNIPIVRPASPALGDVAVYLRSLSNEEVDLFIRQIRYIMTNEDLVVFKELDYAGKRLALEQFWQRRNPNPNSPENEYFKQYMTRLSIANTRFSKGYEPGWLTDRGRILMKYGPPDEVETHPLTVDTKPYEVWHYFAIEGGLEYIFLDEQGYNQYRLIYSNDRTEINDPGWEELIKNLE
jgi:GWxTD domain-containing protein